MVNIALWETQQPQVQLGTTEPEGLAAGSFVTLNVIGDNSGSTGGNLGLNTDFEVEIALTTSGTSGSPAYVPIYAMPLRNDGGYGDGTASGTTLPGAQYWIGNIAVTQNTTGVVRGYGKIGYLDPNKYQFGISNSFANALAATGTFGVWIRPAAINLNG